MHLRSRFIPLILATLVFASCGTMTGQNAKEASIQALVTATRTARLLVTSAGLLADSHVITEQSWQQIAAESKKIGAALQSWQDAIRANQSTDGYQLVVTQALAIIESLLPVAHHSNLVPFPGDLHNPQTFRHAA